MQGSWTERARRIVARWCSQRRASGVRKTRSVPADVLVRARARGGGGVAALRERPEPDDTPFAPTIMTHDQGVHDATIPRFLPPCWRSAGPASPWPRATTRRTTARPSRTPQYRYSTAWETITSRSARRPATPSVPSAKASCWCRDQTASGPRARSRKTCGSIPPARCATGAWTSRWDRTSMPP